MSKQMLTNIGLLIWKYKVNFVLLIMLALTTSGCASILNPYEENFSCRANPGGRCISINNAYEESTGDRIASTRPVDVEGAGQATHGKKDAEPSDSNFTVEECKGDKDCIAATVSARVKSQAESSYQVASQNKMARMLKDPVTPLVAPPTVLRVLILPYQDDESGLNLMRYTYIMVDKPKWIMGDYLNEGVNVQ